MKKGILLAVSALAGVFAANAQIDSTQVAPVRDTLVTPTVQEAPRDTTDVSAQRPSSRHNEVWNKVGLEVRGGLNIAWISHELSPIPMQVSPNVGLHFGCLATLNFSKYLGMETGLVFTSKGETWKVDGYNRNTGARIEGEANLYCNYLELPVHFRVRVPLGNVTLFARTGPYFAFATHGNVLAKGDFVTFARGGNRSGSTDKERFKLKVGNTADADFRSFDSGWAIATGVEIGKATIGLQFSFGFLDVYNTPFNTYDPQTGTRGQAEWGDTRNYAFTITGGYRFF